MAGTWGERWTLETGDLCLFVGDSDIYKQFRQGVLYQVVKKDPAPATSFSQHKYTLRVAFDVESPSGSHTDVFTIHGTRSLKKISLLDLGVLRLCLDDFIKWWARTQGMEDEETTDIEVVKKLVE